MIPFIFFEESQASLFLFTINLYLLKRVEQTNLWSHDQLVALLQHYLGGLIFLQWQWIVIEFVLASFISVDETLLLQLFLLKYFRDRKAIIFIFFRIFLQELKLSIFSAFHTLRISANHKGKGLETTGNFENTIIFLFLMILKKSEQAFFTF